VQLINYTHWGRITYSSNSTFQLIITYHYHSIRVMNIKFCLSLVLHLLQWRGNNFGITAHCKIRDMRWHSWLRHCFTSQKFAYLIPSGIIRIFHWHNPSGRNMALGLSQPLTELSTRNISWGVNAACALGWQPYHLHMPIVLNCGSPNLLESSGPAQACNGIALPFYSFQKSHQKNQV